MAAGARKALRADCSHDYRRSTARARPTWSRCNSRGRPRGFTGSCCREPPGLPSRIVTSGRAAGRRYRRGEMIPCQREGRGRRTARGAVLGAAWLGQGQIRGKREASIGGMADWGRACGAGQWRKRGKRGNSGATASQPRVGCLKRACCYRAQAPALPTAARCCATIRPARWALSG